MKTPRRALLAGMSSCLIAAASARPALAVQPAKPWNHWEKYDPGSSERIDHSLWGDILERRWSMGGDSIARFDYAGMTSEEDAALNRYLTMLCDVVPARLGRAEQLAYWINLYNALTVRVVLDHYPVDSIRDIDISPGFFSNGPWGARLIEVDGQELCLDDIEHRIIRPIWNDPRIHYAVNCASLGCPDLRRQPYQSDRITTDLDYAAMNYVNHPRGVTIINGRLVVSSLYRWYAEDFGRSDRGIIRHLLAYAGPMLAYELQTFRRIDDDRYDWQLNEPD